MPLPVLVTPATTFCTTISVFPSRWNIFARLGGGGKMGQPSTIQFRRYIGDATTAAIPDKIANRFTIVLLFSPDCHSARNTTKTSSTNEMIAVYFVSIAIPQKIPASVNSRMLLASHATLTPARTYAAANASIYPQFAPI